MDVYIHFPIRLRGIALMEGTMAHETSYPELCHGLLQSAGTVLQVLTAELVSFGEPDYPSAMQVCL
jgi:hypothetical protein